MKNYIRSLPISYGDSPKPQRNLKSATTPTSASPNVFSPFEISGFPQIKPPSRQHLSLSPKNKVEVLNSLIEELNEIETQDLRKFIGTTQKDLTSRVNDLKTLTRLDAEEYLKIKMQRWKNRRFIKVDEREIRLIIKRDTKAMKNDY